jgi:hypothetical protein
MDLRAYYQKVRETEASMTSPHVVVVSLATPDGGKSGLVTEVPTPIAARMVVEGAARQATDAEIHSFRAQQTAAKQAADDAVTASRVQVVVVPASVPAKPPVRSGKEL